MLTVPFKKLRPGAIIPTYGSDLAAGMDLAMPTDALGTFLLPGERLLVKLGLAAAVPEGHYGRIAPRSGHAFKHGIDVLAGVVDSDYRGELGVILINTDPNHSFAINPGDRIAQFVIEKISRPAIMEVDDLPETNRGDGGFGSTGVQAA